MENKDRLQFKFNTILNASSDADYQESVTNRCTSLMKYLVSKNLLAVNPLNENGIIKSDLILRSSDFKANAHLLFGKPVMKWFRYLDKGGKMDNFTILEKAIIELGIKHDKPN